MENIQKNPILNHSDRKPTKNISIYKRNKKPSNYKWIGVFKIAQNYFANHEPSAR